MPPGPELDGARARIRRLSSRLGATPRERYVRYLASLSGLACERLYTPEYAEVVGRPALADDLSALWDSSTADDPLDRLLDVDVQSYLADDLLVKMDIATMAHSLEARSPLLDHELMEFAASLPPRLKAHRGERKIALRAALRGWVPDAVLDGPKRGFRLPIAAWLRGELGRHAREVLLDPHTVARGWFRESYVRTLLDRHTARREDHSQAIWTLLMLELWLRELVEHVPPSRNALLRAR